ncbi:MAG: tetratricopeptide repeat protein [Thermoanaerobaculia bacterium]|nr:tetratricopeptide repeat protein [Thermoanaerobaculia bacterium]
MSKQSKPLLLLVVAGLYLAGCRPSVELPELQEVPAPDLSAAEPPVANQVDEARQHLVETLGSPESLLEVADAYGHLAEVYHAYELRGPAAIAYANAATLDPTNPVWRYEKGLAAYDDGDFTTALELFREAQKLQPAMNVARLRLAETHLALGEAEEARQAAAPLLEDRDYGVAARWVTARAASSVGDDEAAAESFRAVLDAAPGADVVHRPLGQTLLRLGRKAEARMHLDHEGKGQVPFPDPLLERVLSLARTAAAHLRRGNQALVAERAEQAAEEFRSGLEVDPEHLELRLSLGLAQIRDGRPADALETFETAVQHHPDEARAHHDLANALRAVGRPQEAAEAFRHAVELEPDYGSAWFNLGNVLSGLKRWDEAEAALRRHREIEPHDRRSAYLLAMAQNGRGDAEAAAIQLQDLLTEDPNDPVVRRGLADVLLDSGKPAAAAGVWRQVGALDLPVADRGQMLDTGGRSLWQKGRRRQALELWHQWVRIAPESSEARTALANALQLMGQRQEAEEEFSRAIQLDPQNATAWQSEISLRILRGDYETAALRADEALAIHPDHAGLLDLTARLLATAPLDTLRDGQRALLLADQARRIEPALQFSETYAMALAELGRFDDAVKLQTDLARQAQGMGDRQALTRIVAQLRRYEMRQPVRVEAQQ